MCEATPLGEEADMTTALAGPDTFEDLLSDAGEVEPFRAAFDADGHVLLGGELDVGGLESLRSVLNQAFSAPGNVLIDAAGLSFIDSRAIAELLRYQVYAATQRRELCLVRVSATLARVLDILDLRHVLEAADSPST